MSNQGNLGADEKRLAELGYKQELERSGVLHELRHLVLDHLDPGGMLYELRHRLVLWRPRRGLVGLADRRRVHPPDRPCMAEIVSAFPTAGGIYYWASKLGGLSGAGSPVVQPDRSDRGGGVGRLRGAQFLSITIRTSTRVGMRSTSSASSSSTLPAHVPTRPELFPSHILKYWNNTSA